MNILVMLALGMFALCLLWMVQSVALKIAGEPLAWPLQYTTKRPLVRWTGRVMIQVCWLVILLGMWLALDIHPMDALRQAFPTPVPWRDIAIAFCIVLVSGALMYALMLAMGWARIEPQHDQATRRGKLLRRFLGPVPLATMEEAVFRGILLEQLLRSLPSSSTSTVIAILVSSAIFASVHFVKPRSHKSVWQAAWGLFCVGCLFGFAYVVGGRSLWLPIAMHAAAIFLLEVMRLYTEIEGPPWLVGYSEWPQSGVLGTIGVIGMAIALVVLI